MNCVERALWVALLIPLAVGCSMGRVYVGSKLRVDPEGAIVPGSTTKAEVLASFGPPERIIRQFDGDVFLYEYLQRYSSSIKIKEPVVTKWRLFTYSKVQSKKDSLVVLFDTKGTVQNYGFMRGTEDLDVF